jgi:glycine cleavage system aminomethyltransferase T
VLVGRETILRDGETVGYLTSGGYGYTLGQSIGYGYVRHEGGVDDAFLAAGATSWWWRTRPCPRASCPGPPTTRRARG